MLSLFWMMFKFVLIEMIILCCVKQDVLSCGNWCLWFVVRIVPQMHCFKSATSKTLPRLERPMANFVPTWTDAVLLLPSSTKVLPSFSGLLSSSFNCMLWLLAPLHTLPLLICLLSLLPLLLKVLALLCLHHLPTWLMMMTLLMDLPVVDLWIFTRACVELPGCPTQERPSISIQAPSETPCPFQSRKYCSFLL